MSPRDVLDLADHLLQLAGDPQQVQPTPAALRRSAVSRGYYSLYLRAIVFLHRIGFTTDAANSRSVHRDLIDCLSSAKNVDLRMVSNYLATLSAARKQADYHLSDRITETQSRVSQWLSLARLTFDLLDNIPVDDLGAVATAVSAYVTARRQDFAIVRKS